MHGVFCLQDSQPQFLNQEDCTYHVLWSTAKACHVNTEPPTGTGDCTVTNPTTGYCGDSLFLWGGGGRDWVVCLEGVATVFPSVDSHCSVSNNITSHCRTFLFLNNFSFFSYDAAENKICMMQVLKVLLIPIISFLRRFAQFTNQTPILYILYSIPSCDCCCDTGIHSLCVGFRYDLSRFTKSLGGYVVSHEDLHSFPINVCAAVSGSASGETSGKHSFCKFVNVCEGFIW